MCLLRFIFIKCLQDHRLGYVLILQFPLHTLMMHTHNEWLLFPFLAHVTLMNHFYRIRIKQGENKMKYNNNIPSKFLKREHLETHQDPRSCTQRRVTKEESACLLLSYSHRLCHFTHSHSSPRQKWMEKCSVKHQH